MTDDNQMKQMLELMAAIMGNSQGLILVDDENRGFSFKYEKDKGFDEIANHIQFIERWMKNVIVEYLIVSESKTAELINEAESIHVPECTDGNITWWYVPEALWEMSDERHPITDEMRAWVPRSQIFVDNENRLYPFSVAGSEDEVKFRLERLNGEIHPATILRHHLVPTETLREELGDMEELGQGIKRWDLNDAITASILETTEL
jgi:hypothetical protein